MPEAFNPLAAVLAHRHGAGTLNSAVIGVSDEDNLLVHSCGFHAARQKIRELSPEGELLFRADFDPVLTWSLQATVLDWAGLANAHPGPLARQSLVFANGGRIPHQFLAFKTQYDGEEPGILYYEDPRTEHQGGDTPELSVTITLEFSDLDTEHYAGHETFTPGGWTVFVPSVTPGEPIPEFVEIPVQTPALIMDAGREALGEDVFLGADNYAGAPLRATLYDGDPLGAGVAVSDPLTLAPWLAQTEPGVPETTVTRNDAAVDWPAIAAARSCTHILWDRNGINVASKALAAPLTIPAFQGVRAPAGALALQLTWPLAGDLAAAATAPPARLATRYLFNAETLDLSETALHVTCCNGDPHTTGTAIGDSDLTLARSGAGWTVAGSTSTSAAAVNGTDTAPPGGWTIPFAVVSLEGVMVCVVVEFDPPLFVPEGGTISISAGDLTVTIA